MNQLCQLYEQTGPTVSVRSSFPVVMLKQYSTMSSPTQ